MSLRSNSYILIVDDLLDNLFLLQALLEAEGYTVDVATSGSIALAKVKDSPPDLLLLDIMMPGVNGYEVTQQIRRDKTIPYIPIVLITAHDESVAAYGLALGANDFVRKPIDFDELLASIRVFFNEN